jgi:hypothetical protein
LHFIIFGVLGVESPRGGAIHDNGREDRVFQFQSCMVGNIEGLMAVYGSLLRHSRLSFGSNFVPTLFYLPFYVWRYMYIYIYMDWYIPWYHPLPVVSSRHDREMRFVINVKEGENTNTPQMSDFTFF